MHYSCDKCGKVFKFKSKLQEHLNRKSPCIKPLILTQNPEIMSQNPEKYKSLLEITKDKVLSKECVYCQQQFKRVDIKNNHENKCKLKDDYIRNLELKLDKNVKIDNGNCCRFCDNEFTRKDNLKVHYKTCKIKEVYKKELEDELYNVSQLRNSQNNNYNNTTINNNQVYNNIVYVKDSGSLVHNDPSISDNEVLCIEGFQREALINQRLGNVNYTKLKRLIVNLIDNNEYDELYKFLFRDDKNRRMHFMMLGKNVGTTYYEIFDRGKIGKTEKDQLFNRVMGFLCGHLTLLDNSFAILNKKLFTKQSKRSFESVLREPSEQFNMFQNLLE